MSSESALTRKKRPTPDSKTAPGVDHRKRRRNRTTQSCLNCHTSKRMCDRKRPACARCTQLGLTGLCVYEVDDPSQRTGMQDESARLLKRVAELEGVIRELKNKPHPRWFQGTATSAAELQKWALRSHPRPGHEGDQDQLTPNAPSPPNSLSDKSDASSSSTCSTPSSSLAQTYPPTIAVDTGRGRLSQAASSSPSPMVATPTDEFARPHASIAEPSQDWDFGSIFFAHPGLVDGDAEPFTTLTKEPLPLDNSYFPRSNARACGCLHDRSAYNVLLELSLRLRKAAEILSHSESHQLGRQCPLNQRIVELDTFTSNALGSMSFPPEDLSTSMISRPDALRTGNLHSSHAFSQQYRAMISSESLPHLRPAWDSLPGVAEPLAVCEDSFMTWEPPHRS
ncbi:transcriptional regulator family: Fungal Specific TF [Agaricus bisporus var. burnettii]|uniref:Transcriptional regulator family: Fungal Specific TF n=1 Tax=Agaricus bisporus var. burnettii TaxID=192524 RepID=A0A8H7F8D3_AGABI|nr:transcriptional regulator family: Fungal Specific TF [Agaricus bisporus var. burnettii]